MVKRTLPGDLVAVASGLGLAVVADLHLRTMTAVPSTLAQWLTEIGRITALLGTYAAVLVLFLVARIPFLENSVGQDRLIKWHRRLAPWSIWLIVIHVITTITGSAIFVQSNFFSELWTQVTQVDWMLLAFAGLLCFIAIGVSSYRRVRRKMKYSTWWVIHLYIYLGVIFSFMHQVTYGQAFMDQPVAQAFWWALALLSMGSLLTFRWILPFAYSMVAGLRVVSVTEEDNKNVSVVIGGRDLSWIAPKAGQFFQFRFFGAQRWWESHPYSVSRAFDNKTLRVTIKNLGDASSQAHRIRIGSRVMVEGPYGTFTADSRVSDRILMIAGGVGITPIRALLEEMPSDAKVDVFVRTRAESESLLRAEMEALAEQRPLTTVRYLVGSRHEFPINARTLTQAIPDFARRDVYVCGPHTLVTAVLDACNAVNMPKRQIHTEDFAFLP